MNIPDPHLLSQREAEIRQLADRQIAELAEQRAAAVELRRPYFEAKQRCDDIARNVARIECARELQVELAERFRSRLDTMLRGDQGGGTTDFMFLMARDPAETNAERAIQEIDRWLPARKAELAIAEADVAKLAVELQIPVPEQPASPIAPAAVEEVPAPARGTSIHRW